MAKEEEEDLQLDEEEGGEESKQPAAGSQKSGMLIVIIIGFLVMVLTPLITFMVVKLTINQEPEEPKEQEEKSVITYPVEPIVVNIEGTGSTRFLRVAPHLVLSDTRLQPVLAENAALIKDRIISAVGGKTLDALEGTKGREELKKDIKGRINASLEDQMKGIVVDVYFSEYLIQ